MSKTTPQKWAFNFLACPGEKHFGLSVLRKMIDQWDKHNIEWVRGPPMGNDKYTRDELEALGYAGYYTQE